MDYEICKLKSIELDHKPQDSAAGEGWGELLGGCGGFFFFFCMNGFSPSKFCPSVISAWYTCDLPSIHGTQSCYFSCYGMLEVAFFVVVMLSFFSVDSKWLPEKLQGQIICS